MFLFRGYNSFSKGTWPSVMWLGRGIMSENRETEKAQTTRRDALKVTGAAVVGMGTALAGLGAVADAAYGVTAKTAATVGQKNLMLALSRLVNDAKFRTSVATTPSVFTKAYPKLNISQVALLVDVGDAAGIAVHGSSGSIAIPQLCCCCCCFN